MSSLLNNDLRAVLPKLLEQEGATDPIVYAKFFFPASGWTWFVTEGEAQNADFMFYGYVIGFESEWGYFTLCELEEVDVSGFRIERDILFEPTPLSRIRF